MAPNPWNQGYFLFCVGSGCACPSPWNDPQMVAAESRCKDRYLQPVRTPIEGTALRIAPDSDSIPTTFVHQYLSDHKMADRIRPGRKYRWSVRIKTRDITDGPAAGRDQGATLCLAWAGKNADMFLQDHVLRVVGTHDWQTYTGVTTAPANATNLIVFLSVRHAKGEAIFTKASFKAESDDTELIANGSFEKFIATPLTFDDWYGGDASITRSHWRYFCNKYHVGDDVVARYFKLALEFEKPRQAIQAGRPFSISTYVTNTRDTAYYDKAEAAAARDVAVILDLPPGLTLVKQLDVGENTLPAGKRASLAVVACGPKTGCLSLARAEHQSRHARRACGGVTFGTVRPGIHADLLAPIGCMTGRKLFTKGKRK